MPKHLVKNEPGAYFLELNSPIGTHNLLIFANGVLADELRRMAIVFADSLKNSSGYNHSKIECNRGKSFYKLYYLLHQIKY